MATRRGGTGEEKREEFKKQEKGTWSSEVKRGIEKGVKYYEIMGGQSHGNVQYCVYIMYI
jgi:hypothetical protein